MPSDLGGDDGRRVLTARDHASLAARLEADAALTEQMAAEWAADGHPAFARRRLAMAGRLRARAAVHRRAIAVAGLPTD
jgi:hypothetical protein